MAVSFVLDHAGSGPDGGTPSPSSTTKEKLTLSPIRIEVTSGTMCIDVIWATREFDRDAPTVGAEGDRVQLTPMTRSAAMLTAPSGRAEVESGIAVKFWRKR